MILFFIFGFFTIIYLIEKLFFVNFKISADNNNKEEEEIPYSFEELLEKDKILEKEIIKNDKFLSKNLTERGKFLYKNASKSFLYSLKKQTLLEIIAKKDLVELYDRVESKCFILQIQQVLIDKLLKNKKK